MVDTQTRTPQSNDPSRWAVLALFIASAAIALFVALNLSKASLYEGQYHPVGNDAFYHARRIIDTAGERGFYDFDETVHVPEGSAIVWPWGYDYLLGQALGVWQVANPDTPPMQFLAFVPPVLLLINLALFIALTGSVGMPLSLRAVAVFGYALFPFTQLMHGVGAIDHHMVEHGFMLAAAWLAVSWMAKPQSLSTAIALAVVLGVAPAFHNGLFIIQLPLLVGLGVLWLKDALPSRSTAGAFVLTLPSVSLLAALPSSAMRAGSFDFTLLSGFHVYVSVCTAAMTWFLLRFSFNRRTLVMAILIAGSLGMPLILAGGTGIAFIQGDILLLDRIEEMHSPLAGLAGGDFGTMTQLYSGLLLGLPILVGFYVWLLARTRASGEAMFAAYAVIGLLLLCTQIRLQYFGSFALLIGIPLLVHQVVQRRSDWRAPGLLVAVAVTALAFQRPVSAQLFSTQSLSLDVDYAVAVDAFPVLHEACREQPGIVLADNNFGHPVRFHSECTVIANNFLLTPQHEDKIRELLALWQLSPSELANSRPDVRYVLVVLRNLYVPTASGVELASPDTLALNNAPLALALTADALPNRYSVLFERRLQDDGRDFAVVRLLAIATN